MSPYPLTLPNPTLPPLTLPHLQTVPQIQPQVVTATSAAPAGTVMVPIQPNMVQVAPQIATQPMQYYQQAPVQQYQPVQYGPELRGVRPPPLSFCLLPVSCCSLCLSLTR